MSQSEFSATGNGDGNDDGDDVGGRRTQGERRKHQHDCDTQLDYIQIQKCKFSILLIKIFAQVSSGWYFDFNRTRFFFGC